MSVYIGAAVAIFVLQSITAVVAIRLRRNDLADVIWGPGFLVAGLGALAVQMRGMPDFHFGPRQIIFGSCLAIYALRLFFYLGLRTLHKTEEDPRYLKMRQAWGANWVWRSYVMVFLLQGALMFVVSLPIVSVIQTTEMDSDMTVWSGLVLWICGFVFEAVADAQLKEFKSRPQSKGRLMTEGLWRWSRHPNYFGEVVQWWGLFVMVVPLPAAWISLLSPVVLTFLILKVSGIPLLEKQMEARDGFAEYKRKTSVFIPWPPRRDRS